MELRHHDDVTSYLRYHLLATAAAMMAMEPKQPTCFMKLKGLPCIKTTSPDPRHVDCRQCLWNMGSSSPGSLAAMEKLFSRYKASRRPVAGR